MTTFAQTLRRVAVQEPRRLSPSALSERLVSIVQDDDYRRRLFRHLWLSAGALVIGLLGVAVSLWQLSRPFASGQADQFWLLLLVLAVGLFGVAVLTTAGSLIRHFAMQRIALGQKDLEAYEAVDEREAIVAQVRALSDLSDLVKQVRATYPELELIRSSLKHIVETASMEPPPPPGTWKKVLSEWKALGASDEQIATLDPSYHGISDHSRMKPSSS